MKVPKRWATLLEFSAAFATEPVAGQAAPPVVITFRDGSTRRSYDPDLDPALSEVLGREVKLITTPLDGVAFEELWVDIEGLERGASTTCRHALHHRVAAGPPARGWPPTATSTPTLPAQRRPGQHHPSGTDAGFVENDWPAREMTLGDGVRLGSPTRSTPCGASMSR